MKGLPMKACSEKYTLSEAQIVSIFYNVTRESKGLPPLDPSPRIVRPMSGRVFAMELPDDDPPN